MKETSKIYQEFIFNSSTLDDTCIFPKLSMSERFVLEKLSIEWLQDLTPTVVQGMNITSEISSATLFRNIKRLRLKGYITYKIDELDTRIKYIHPSKQTMMYFSAMGNIIKNSIENS